MYVYCIYSVKFLLSCNSRIFDIENLFIDILIEEDVRILFLIIMNKFMVVDNICYMYLSGIILFYLIYMYSSVF